MDEDLAAEQIRQRALQVGEACAYIGLFDLTVYAGEVAHSVLHVFFGANPIDLLAVFAPEMREAMPADCRHQYMVASKIQEGVALCAQGQVLHGLLLLFSSSVGVPVFLEGAQGPGPMGLFGPVRPGILPLSRGGRTPERAVLVAGGLQNERHG